MLPIELLIALLLVGTVAGLAAGLFGVGGGIVTVPSLLFLTGATFREAVAASLLVIAATSPVGLYTHHRAGKVRWRMGLVFGLGGLGGIGLATLADPYLPDLVLEVAFALFLLWAAKRLVFGARATLLEPPGPLLLGLTGVGAGVVAKLLGIGGGILVVPALVLFGLDIHVAVATSLVSVFTNLRSR